MGIKAAVANYMYLSGRVLEICSRPYDASNRREYLQAVLKSDRAWEAVCNYYGE